VKPLAEAFNPARIPRARENGRQSAHSDHRVNKTFTEKTVDRKTWAMSLSKKAGWPSVSVRSIHAVAAGLAVTMQR
jgi:hypothetical protein